MSFITRNLGAGYTTTAAVREVSGIPVTDVSDAELTDLVQRASQVLHADISHTTRYETPYTMNAGATRFQTHYPFVADSNLDKAVDASDLTVEFLKRDETTGEVLSAATGVVTVEDAARGVFTTANALPEGYSCVVSYDHYPRAVDLNDMDLASAYLAAHFATLRMKGPGNVSRADLTGVGVKDHGNRTSAYRAQRTIFLKSYDLVVRRIRGAGGAVV